MSIRSFGVSAFLGRHAFAAVLIFTASSVSIAQTFRTIDGSGNNAVNTDWGQTNTALLRVTPADYPDGIGDEYLVPPTRPNARVISNALFGQTTSLSSTVGMSSGVWQWGQFLDHDIDLSTSRGDQPVIIFAPPDDPYGMAMIPMNRSDYVDCVGCPRQQKNAITSYIDASNVYGADAARAAALRQGVGGRMRTSAGNLLPTSDMTGLDNGSVFMDGGGNPATMFVAGDIRANEQLGLTAMHTLFVREHNRIAAALATQYDPVADDELIYQKARAVVGAEMQAITYNEFLPMLLGDFAPTAADYSYDPGANAGINNSFSTAFYRVGHTMLNENLLLASEQGQTIGAMPLRDAFFTGSSVIGGAPELIDKLLMGLAAQTAQDIDSKMVDDVRNFLFAPSGGVGFDLASLNIERGRDHGLADYNTFRQAYSELLGGVPGFENVDLSPAASFAELDMPPDVIAILETLYDSVDNIDPWVGALAENHVDGAGVGPLILAAMVDQFTRLRDGDAFFYTGDDYLWSDELSSIVAFDDLHLMDIIAWNTDMKNSPMNFFNAPSQVPEPSTMLIALSLFGAGLACRRKL